MSDQPLTVQTLEPGDDLQAAVDRAASPGLIELAPGDYPLPHPLIIPTDRLTLRGAGRDVSRLGGPHATGHGLIVLRDGPLAGDEFVAVDGLLDVTAAGRLGVHLPDKRRLVGLPGGGAAVRQGAYLTRDYWGGVRTLTIDLAARFRATHGDVATLLGFDRFQDDPSPWLLIAGFHVGVYWFRWRRPDGSLGSLTFPCGDPTTGVQRLTIQLDFDRGEAWVFLNGTRAAIEEGGPPPGDAFLANEFAEFAARGNPLDWDLLGLKLCPALLYDDAGQRRDGQAATDRVRYFTNENAPEAWSWMLTGEAMPRRFVKAMAGYGAEWLLLLGPDHYSPWSAVAGVTIEALTLAGNTHGGQGISWGQAVDLTIRDCRIEGWTHAIGTLKTGPSWPVTLANLRLNTDGGGGDRSLVLSGCTTHARDLDLGYGGRSYLYYHASGGSLTNVFAAGPHPDDALLEYYGVFVAGDDPGAVTLSAVGVDDERPTAGVLRAGWRIDAPGLGPYQLTCHDTRLHLPTADVPAFLLTGPATRAATPGDPEPPPDCALALSGVAIDRGAAVADIRSPRWWVGPAGAVPPGVPWHSGGPS